MDPSHSKPLIRWFGTTGDNPNQQSGSPYSSQPSTPVSATAPIGNHAAPTSFPPSPTLDSLNEALNETLVPHITTPPQAKLPEHFQASRPLSRPPTLMLPSSTMPTASLARQSRTPSPLDPDNSPPIDTSWDTLRKVSKSYGLQQTRGMSTSSKASASVDLPVNNSSGWWFFNNENKENVDTILDDADRADTVSEEQENIRKRYRSPNNPVVFCHGLLGFDSVSIGLAIAPVEVSHWRGIKEVLEANGTEVLITRVPATSSPVDRAKVLEERISEVYPGRSVHLIGHSMGGLDCRYLTTHLTERKFDVLSITTIATPHRGSSFADHFLSTLGQDRMPSFLQLLDFLPNGGGDGKAFESLTVESMRQFNKEVPNVEGVKYFSWGSVYEPGFIDTWKWPHGVIKEKEGPNDGLVSVYSARWGTYLGTLQGVNHLDLVGWINTARYRWAAMMGKEIKFRPATFYLGIADMLAKEVEGQDEIDGGSNGSGSPGGLPSGDESGDIAERQTHRESTRTSNVATPPPASPLSGSRPQTPRQSLGERLSAAVQAPPAASATDTRP